MTLPRTFSLRPTTPDDAPVFHPVMMAAGMDPRSSWSRTTVDDVRWSLGQGAASSLSWGRRPWAASAGDRTAEKR